MKFDSKSRCKSCGEFKSTESMKSIKVGKALLRSVEQAQRDGRVITGIVDIATELKGSSVNNMFCVMNNSDCDDMQCVLLEAYCREHKVKLIKVDRVSEKSCQNVCNGDDICRLPDCSSFLFKLPEHCSNEDDFILSFYKTHQLFVNTTFPTVKISD